MTRWFRHDLESCMWCILLHSLKHERADLYTGLPYIVRRLKIAIVTDFERDDLKEDWEPYFKFLRRWVRVFRDRIEDQKDLAIEEKSVEKKLIIWQEAERKSKSEDFMKPDAQMAKKELGSKGAKALEDLSWINVEVYVDYNKKG